MAASFHPGLCKARSVHTSQLLSQQPAYTTFGVTHQNHAMPTKIKVIIEEEMHSKTHFEVIASYLWD